MGMHNGNNTRNFEPRQDGIDAMLEYGHLTTWYHMYLGRYRKKACSDTRRNMGYKTALHALTIPLCCLNWPF